MNTGSISFSVTIKELYDVYFWGASEGLLAAETERLSEEMFDAAVCEHSGKKYCVPSAPVRRRQLRSDKWFEAMKKDKGKFVDFLALKISTAENRKKKKQTVIDGNGVFDFLK